MKVLAVADSDSYLKWAACLLGDLPEGCTTELAVIRTPITPSPAQIHAAVAGAPWFRPAASDTGAGREPGAQAGDPPVVSARALRRTAERFRPDAVLLACTGPVVDILAAEVLAGLSPRPVFVSGLPGISIPATEKAWLFRSGCELFVLHSGREVREFTEVGRRLGGGGQVGLARLPFLHGSGEVPATGPRDRVVFATQAKVPKRREERERILASLADLARRRPDLDVVVKLRALDGERQTHNERHHYQRLWRELGGDEDVLRFAAGPMHEHLAHAAGFVTVSSTAALEAIAQSVPLLVLSDFGVSAEMINLVFEGSGVLGTLDDLSGDVSSPRTRSGAAPTTSTRARRTTGRAGWSPSSDRPARAASSRPARCSTALSTPPPAAAPGSASRCRRRCCASATGPSAGCAATSGRWADRLSRPQPERRTFHGGRDRHRGDPSTRRPGPSTRVSGARCSRSPSTTGGSDRTSAGRASRPPVPRGRAPLRAGPAPTTAPGTAGGGVFRACRPRRGTAGRRAAAPGRSGAGA
nr:hypothetical protein GCM10020093_004440 [Planobispora longispora]